MKLLIYDYLPETQILTSLEKSAISKFKVEPLKFVTPIGLLRGLLSINTDNNDMILTFLSHANEIRLGNGNGDELFIISYDVLLPILNIVRTKHKLIINMMANCNSHGVENFRNLAPNVDEFWVTTQDAMSIPQALLAVEDYLAYQDSSLFEERNDNNTDFLFKRIS